MSQLAVSTTIHAISPVGERMTIDVEIGVRSQDRELSWSCSVVLRPLYNKLANATGGDSLHSMCLAISLVLDLLHDFREKGGKLLYDDGTEFALEAYAFGFALNRGKPAT